MPEDTFLQDLILGYCRQVGGLVEPPAYGIHETLLPDEVAARWGVDAIQRFNFAGEGDSGPTQGDATLIHYGHPLVETIVAELRQQTANGQFFVNNLRLEKPGLYAVIEKALNLPNAKLFPVRGVVERQRMYDLVCFNFKASMISDEKRELILPVWMNLQGGYVVKRAEIERLAILDSENQFRHLAPAEPTWIAGETHSIKVLGALLDRARGSALIELAPNLEGLQKRLRRFLELDRARLTEYYQDLTKDAEKRLHKADEERRPVLEAKLKSIIAECQVKLADVEQKYDLRVELELINLAIIAQPKLDLLVEIKKRTATVTRQVVWDPLRHIVEPLVCDVCGQSGDGLHLCENGHLAHESCLTPQCVECKRTYCQKCADQMQTCAVCDRPICIHSLVKCAQCQRITCHDHLNECHAADGQPHRLQAASISPSPAPEAPTPSTPAEPSTGRVNLRKKESTKEKSSLAKTKDAAPPTARGDYLEVYTDPANELVSAYVMFRKRTLAERTWELTENGISVRCRCEKERACRAHGFIHRPAELDGIEMQMERFIRQLCLEYRVTEKKVHYYHVRQGQPFEVPKLKLPARWKDPGVQAAARQGFDKLR